MGLSREQFVKALQASIELFNSKELAERIAVLRGDDEAATKAVDTAQKEKLASLGLNISEVFAEFRTASQKYKDDEEVMRLLMLCASSEEQAVAKAATPDEFAQVQGLMQKAQEEMHRVQHDSSLSDEQKQQKIMEVMQKVQREAMQMQGGFPTPQQMMGPRAGIPGAVPFAPPQQMRMDDGKKK